MKVKNVVPKDGVMKHTSNLENIGELFANQPRSIARVLEMRVTLAESPEEELETLLTNQREVVKFSLRNPMPKSNCKWSWVWAYRRIIFGQMTLEEAEEWYLSNSKQE